MADIFISYASEDRHRIEPLAISLEEQGWSVFWDRTIPAGKTWRQVIGNALETARTVVVAWSKTSVDSRWVQEEADRGLERNILIPILIDNVRPPLGFGTIQAADLINWESSKSSAEFEKLIADISTLLAPPPMGAKEAERPPEAEREAKREKKVQEESRRKEVPYQVKEQAKQKAKEPEIKIRRSQPKKPQERPTFLYKSKKIESIGFRILVGVGVGLILAAVAAMTTGDFYLFFSIAALTVISWAIFGAICGKDKIAVVFLIIGFFIGTFIGTFIFDHEKFGIARAIVFAGGGGALIGAISGRLYLSSFKKSG